MLASYCLGASADTTAALMGSENLLCALIEDEEGVKRAFEAIKRIMIDAFSALAAQCEQGGTQLTGWHGIWSPGATTAIQEDFAYMIGADMFDEFCLPHIRDMVDAVPYAFYHLDGAQALRHLPSLCKIPNLRVIQWQPGDGHSAILQWTDVIRTILDSGKLLPDLCPSGGSGAAGARGGRRRTDGHHLGQRGGNIPPGGALRSGQPGLRAAGGRGVVPSLTKATPHNSLICAVFP